MKAFIPQKTGSSFKIKWVHHLVFIIVFGLITPENGFSQWIPSHTLIPPINGYAWYEFAFGSCDTGYLAANRFFSVSTGFDYDLLKTTDGGITWSQVTALIEQEHPEGPPGSYIIDMESPHPDTLLVTRHGYFNFLDRFDPGGGLSLRFTYDLPIDLSAINGREAWILTKKLYPVALSLFHFTNDTLIRVFETDTLTVGTASKVFFPSSNTGFIIAWHNQENVMLKTVDGGLNFSTITPPATEIPSQTWFTSDSCGFLACSSGNIYRTTNQGNTWTLVCSGMIPLPSDINFHGDSLGMVCGSMGSTAMTADGGQSWSSHPCKSNLTGVAVFSPDRAYVCNNNSFPTFYKGIYPVSAGEGSIKEFTIYPNPAKDEIFIEYPDAPEKKWAYEIIDFQGRILLKETTEYRVPIQVMSLKSGIYLLRILMDNSVVTRKIIIE